MSRFNPISNWQFRMNIFKVYAPRCRTPFQSNLCNDEHWTRRLEMNFFITVTFEFFAFFFLCVNFKFELNQHKTSDLDKIFYRCVQRYARHPCCAVVSRSLIPHICWQSDIDKIYFKLQMDKSTLTYIHHFAYKYILLPKRKHRV